jgi:hypothetical protein
MALTKAKLIELIEAGEFDEYLGGEVTKEAVEAVLTGNITSHTHDSKLDASAYTAADVLSKIKTVDGQGSGLDSDLFDGLDSAKFGQIVAADFSTLASKVYDMSTYGFGAYLLSVSATSTSNSNHGLYYIMYTNDTYLSVFPIISGANISVTASDGNVTVTPTVSSRYYLTRISNTLTY